MYYKLFYSLSRLRTY